MNIEFQSMARLRELHFAGRLSFDELENERIRRIREQKEIKSCERQMFASWSHPQRNACCPIEFASDLAGFRR